MADQQMHATKLDINKLQQNSPGKFATIQKKNSKQDMIIIILASLLVIVIGVIVYIQLQ